MAALADLPELAAKISAELDEAGIAHAVSGAIAMAAHGYVRATKDLDILVVASAHQLPRVFEIVRGHGFQGDDAELIESLRTRYLAALRSGPVTVEILIPALPYHHTVLERAVRRDLPGGRVPFVSVEDLVILKMLWRRAKDIPDIQAMIANAETLDDDYIREALAGILPPEDPRHAEIEDLLERFGR